MTALLPTDVLGRTGLRVTRLGYGAAHRKPMDDRQRNVILNAVLDFGINFIDTAISYGNSEELIAKFIGHRRSEFFIATKGHVWTMEGIIDGLNRSLRRLKTEYVDVMQLHGPTVEECKKGDLVKALQKLRNLCNKHFCTCLNCFPTTAGYMRIMVIGLGLRNSILWRKNIFDVHLN